MFFVSEHAVKPTINIIIYIKDFFIVVYFFSASFCSSSFFAAAGFGSSEAEGSFRRIC